MELTKLCQIDKGDIIPDVAYKESNKNMVNRQEHNDLLLKILHMYVERMEVLNLQHSHALPNAQQSPLASYKPLLSRVEININYNYKILNLRGSGNWYEISCINSYHYRHCDDK